MSLLVHSYPTIRGPRRTFIACARCGAEIKRGRKFCAPCSHEHARELKERRQAAERERLREIRAACALGKATP